jgi:hypothetical protein
MVFTLHCVKWLSIQLLGGASPATIEQQIPVHSLQDLINTHYKQILPNPGLTGAQPGNYPDRLPA